MTTVYDEDNDELIDDKSGEPVAKAVHDVLYDMKFSLMNEVMEISQVTTHRHYQSMKDRLDVIEEMYNGLKK